jgi:CRP-like cAMP-binding protein
MHCQSSIKEEAYPGDEALPNREKPSGSEQGSTASVSPSLTKTQHKPISSLPSPTKVPAGTLLVAHRDSPAFVGLIRSGIVKLEVAMDAGTPLTLGLRSSGSWINADLALLSMPSLCSVCALTECEIIKLSPDDFKKRIVNDIALMNEVLLLQCRELLMGQQQSITRMRTAAERLRGRPKQNNQIIRDSLDQARASSRRNISELLALSPDLSGGENSKLNREGPDSE